MVSGTSGRAGSAQVHAWLERAAARIESEQDSLNRLDGVAGDGDHGATMVMGFRQILGDAEQAPAPSTPGRVLRAAGASFASVGGSAGPLWGTALLRAGRACGEREWLDAAAVLSAAEAGLEGMEARGRCEPGSKTMVDAMAPAVAAMREAVAAGANLSEALALGAAAAERGAGETSSMFPQRGRARRQAGRSIGHIDPGAASCALIWAAAAETADAGSPS